VSLIPDPALIPWTAVEIHELARLEAIEAPRPPAVNERIQLLYLQRWLWQKHVPGAALVAVWEFTREWACFRAWQGAELAAAWRWIATHRCARIGRQVGRRRVFAIERNGARAHRTPGARTTPRWRLPA
jgi:hypothetical protein